jgi:transcription elongation factor GreB
MARYRPPAAEKSPYITTEGFERLQAEEKTIWKRRRHVVKILAAAAAEGDRSENAEYIYRKKELRGIDRRIRYLQRRLPTLIAAGGKPDIEVQVFFGAWVTLEDERGVEHHYRIVGPDEFDQHRDYISMDSPMAKALLRRHLDEEVNVHTPDGARSYIITQINYD